MIGQMNQKSDLNHISRLANKLIHEKFTMTLATACRDAAWAAPVYFVFCNGGFYFFSNPRSRHIRQTLGSGQAAAAIYEESAQWEGLKGIQMSGKIEAVSPGTGAVNAFRAYVDKFPLIRSFISDPASFNLEGIFSLFQARLYCFVPELLVYMDNTIHFGFKKEIQPETLGL
jgi:uncharacterized protein YhbP (UPF0306 family)